MVYRPSDKATGLAVALEELGLSRTGDCIGRCRERSRFAPVLWVRGRRRQRTCRVKGRADFVTHGSVRTASSIFIDRMLAMIWRDVCAHRKGPPSPRGTQIDQLFLRPVRYQFQGGRRDPVRTLAAVFQPISPISCPPNGKRCSSRTAPAYAACATALRGGISRALVMARAEFAGVVRFTIEASSIQTGPVKRLQYQGALSSSARRHKPSPPSSCHV